MRADAFACRYMSVQATILAAVDSILALEGKVLTQTGGAGAHATVQNQDPYGIIYIFSGFNLHTRNPSPDFIYLSFSIPRSFSLCVSA